jgi:choline dehydrogenase-like flavoprotein
MMRDFYVDDRQNPYTTPKGKPFNWFRGRQLGGRLHTWARLAIRMSDLDLKSGRRRGVGFDWPIAYADLAPYYDRVETFLGIDGGRDGLPQVPDARILEPITPTPAEAEFRAAIATKWPDRPVIGPRVIRHNPGRIPKEIAAAERTGLLVVRTGGVVEALVYDSHTGRARGVRYIDKDTKVSSEAFAKIIFLCASTIETLRIMLNSTSSQHPGGLGGSSEVLGRYFMDQTMFGLGGTLPVERSQPSASGTDRYDFGRVHGFYIPPWGDQQRKGSGIVGGFHVQGAVGRGWPGWWMLAHGEVLPYVTNTVTLDPQVRDAWGVPAARIDLEYGDNELQMIAAQHDALEEMSHIAGLEVRAPGGTGPLNRMAFGLLKSRVLRSDGAFIPGASVHEVGGARMGDDPKTSVLNRYNQCWESPNVFVTDGACFVTSGSQNTTLTIMALTARASDFAAEEHRRGAFD